MKLFAIDYRDISTFAVVVVVVVVDFRPSKLDHIHGIEATHTNGSFIFSFSSHSLIYYT